MGRRSHKIASILKKKKLYPIFGKVLCRTLKLIIVFKNHFHPDYYAATPFWWEISQRERGIFCQVFDSLVVFLCHWVRLLRDGSASLSRDLLPPPCLLPAQGGTTVGRAPDGLFCHTLRNAIDCSSEKAIYSNLWGERLGVKATSWANEAPFFLWPAGVDFGYLQPKVATQDLKIYLCALHVASPTLQYTLVPWGKQ